MIILPLFIDYGTKYEEISNSVMKIIKKFHQQTSVSLDTYKTLVMTAAYSSKTAAINITKKLYEEHFFENAEIIKILELWCINIEITGNLIDVRSCNNLLKFVNTFETFFSKESFTPDSQEKINEIGDFLNTKLNENKLNQKIRGILAKVLKILRVEIDETKSETDKIDESFQNLVKSIQDDVAFHQVLVFKNPSREAKFFLKNVLKNSSRSGKFAIVLANLSGLKCQILRDEVLRYLKISLINQSIEDTRANFDDSMNVAMCKFVSELLFQGCIRFDILRMYVSGLEMIKTNSQIYPGCKSLINIAYRSSVMLKEIKKSNRNVHFGS